jgi:hypothetical protein
MKKFISEKNYREKAMLIEPHHLTLKEDVFILWEK